MIMASAQTCVSRDFSIVPRTRRDVKVEDILSGKDHALEAKETAKALLMRARMYPVEKRLLELTDPEKDISKTLRALLKDIYGKNDCLLRAHAASEYASRYLPGDLESNLLHMDVLGEMHGIGAGTVARMAGMLGGIGEADKPEFVSTIREIACLTHPSVSDGLEPLRRMAEGEDMELAVHALWAYAYSYPAHARSIEALEKYCRDLMNDRLSDEVKYKELIEGLSGVLQEIYRNNF
jgi:hypothetical protein